MIKIFVCVLNLKLHYRRSIIIPWNVITKYKRHCCSSLLRSSSQSIHIHRVHLAVDLTIRYINTATLTSTLFKSKVLFHIFSPSSHKYTITLSKTPVESTIYATSIKPWTYVPHMIISSRNNRTTCEEVISRGERSVSCFVRSWFESRRGFTTHEDL